MQNKAFYFQMAVKSVEEDDDGGVTITGLASTPDIDRYRDVVEPTAFKDALELFMKNPALLRSHDSDRPAGSVTSAKVTGKGLEITARVIDPQTVTEVKDGRMRALSIGYIPLFTQLQIEKDDGSLREFNEETDSAWGQDVVRVIKALDLVEISIVATPANGNALFTIQKSIKQATNAMVCKAFNINDESMKNKKKEIIEAKEAEDVTPEDEVKKDDAVETPDDAKEEVTPDATDDKAPEEEKEESKEADEVTTPEAEEAEKAGETPSTDDAEGEDEEKSEDDAEEADADAKPEDEESDEKVEEDEEEGDEKKALLILDAKDLADLTMLKRVGAVRAAAEGEEAQALSPEAKEVMALADMALGLAEKAINDLEEKLDKFSDKKALAGHSQDEAVGGDVEVNKRDSKMVSKGFAMLFGGGKE